MIEIDFQDFLDQNYEETGYELYVMKNGLGDVLYIEIEREKLLDDVYRKIFEKHE